MDSSGFLADSVVRVSVKEDSTVCFCWPQRDVEVAFHCVEIVPGYSCVSVRLPSSLAERSLANMKHIISIELDLLKSILEKNTHDVIPDRVHQQIQTYHLNVYGVEPRKKLPADADEEFGFRGEVVTDGALLNQMSTDLVSR